MIYLVRLGFFVLVLSLWGILNPAVAEEPKQKPDRGKKSSIELKEAEITGSLRDVVGTFKLQEMEIVGGTDEPRLNYIMPWQNPVPFPDEEADLARGLIEQSYAPLDREAYTREIQLATGP